jgi:hypothetical protein
MERSKNYRVLVEQVDRFSHEFIVSAMSEKEAKTIVEKMVEEEPLDSRKNTFDGTVITATLIDSPVQVHTVEALFDIDKDISDEEVILVDDLSRKQKTFLGIEKADEATFCVASSGGSLEVDRVSGDVIECTTHRNEDNELKRIERFDLQEYKMHYNVARIPEQLDILDLGYWSKDGSYEKAVGDWRNEMRRVE